jgi:hypothetical protein
MRARVSYRSIAGSTRISIPKTNSYVFGAGFGAAFGAPCLPQCDGIAYLCCLFFDTNNVPQPYAHSACAKPFLSRGIAFGSEVRSGRASSSTDRGDGKEQRKILVLSLQAIDLPLPYDAGLRGDSIPFATVFLA